MTYFAHRPVFAMVISIVIVIVGLISMQGLPMAQYPDITPPEVEISTTYTGASAVDVEQSVATPIEQKVNGVEDMIYMKSTNASDGQLKLRVSFEVGTDLDMANVLVQNRLSEAMATLPEDVTKFGVTVKKALAFPLMIVDLYSPKGTFDNNFLSNYANINLVDAISRIRGVGQVTLFGGSDYAMRIWIKPDRLARLTLTVPDVIHAIQEQNVITPGGQLGGAPAPPGTEFTYTVRTAGRLVTAEQFGNVVLRTNPDGSQVRIKDVARVELGSQLYDSQGRLNGKDCAAIAVYQLPDANGLAVADAVRELMKEVQPRLPEDLEYKIALDTTAAVTAGIDEIIVTLMQALGLVIIVVFIFLQDWRATLIPLLAIPVALVGTFAFFPLLGFSINVLSLLGLVLAIGMLVDDAIVIVEAVTVHINAGMKPREATVKAMQEVGGPVVATTLILMAVFIPVGVMGGITGRLYQQFAITIAVSVGVSTINALTLSPALCALLLRPTGKSRGLLARAFGLFNRALDKTTGGYVTVAGFLARRLFRSTLLIGIILAGAVLFGMRVPTGFVPEEDQGYLIVNAQLPDAASLQRTDAVCRKAEEIIINTPGIEFCTTITGYSLLSRSYSSNTGFFFVSLKPWKDRDETQIASAITRRLNQQFRKHIAEGMVMAFGPPPIPGLGTSAGFTLQLQDRSGGSPEFLAEQAQRFIAAANKRPEIARAYTTYRAIVPQVFAEMDNDKVLKLGLRLQDVNQTLGSFLGGSYINDFNRFGRLYKVYIQAEPEYRQKADQLRFFFVRGKDGQAIPLTTLVNVKPTAGPQYTNRFNLFRAAEIGGGPAAGYSSDQALAALEQVAAEVLPPEISHAWANMSYQERASAGSAAQTFVLAMIFVFLILAALYESWSLPCSVLLGTPFAVLGAFAALFIARLSSESYVNNVFAQIGLVMLIGLAAKNAILIVEFAKARREQGQSALDAALDGARDRFRPILMTAFSSLLGFLPLLIATGAGAEARKVIGMGVFGGLLAATILGVLLVPMLFVLIEKLRGGDSPAALARAEDPAPEDPPPEDRRREDPQPDDPLREHEDA
ncbi:MAG: efflux RND transporter permease subunit [Planctomycetota bacterium]